MAGSNDAVNSNDAASNGIVTEQALQKLTDEGVKLGFTPYELLKKTSNGAESPDVAQDSGHNANDVPLKQGVNVRYVDGRPFVVYVPSGVSLSGSHAQAKPEGVLYFNGLDKAGNGPWKDRWKRDWNIWGHIHGVKDEADHDHQISFVGVPQLRLNALSALIPGSIENYTVPGSVTSWSFPQSATGHYVDVNDTKYALDIINFAEKHGIKLDLCVGLSMGGQLCQSLVEERPGVPHKPVFRAIAAFASGKTVNEPQTKPGVSLFLERAHKDPLGIDGGIKPGIDNRGTMTIVFDSEDPTNRNLMFRAIPRLQEMETLYQNGMDPHLNHKEIGIEAKNNHVFFSRTIWGPNAHGVVVVRDAVHLPYWGHFFPGSTDVNTWSNPTPRSLYSGACESARFFGLTCSCESDANVILRPAENKR